MSLKLSFGSERARVGKGVVCLNSTPSPHIYRCGIVALSWKFTKLHLEPTLGANEEMPCRSLKSVELGLVRLN
jgi:hypothetical protein